MYLGSGVRFIHLFSFVLVWHGQIFGMRHVSGDSWLQNQLVKAAARGECAKIKSCVAMGADINMEGQGWDACAPLVAAARAGNVEAGQVLVELGARMDGTARPPGRWQWRKSFCPFDVAAKYGQADFLRMLCKEERIQVRRRRQKLQGLLERAVRQRQEGVACVLFNALGPNLNGFRMCDDAQLLHDFGRRSPDFFGQVVRLGCIALAQRLIKAGVLTTQDCGKTLDIFSLLTDDGASHVHVGSLFDDLRRFVEAGGEADLRAPCLHLAATCTYPMAPGDVIAYGSNDGIWLSSATSLNNELTLLQLIARVPEWSLNAQEATDQACAVVALLQRGANRLAVDGGGRIPLHLAAIAGNLDLIQVLMSVPVHPESAIDPRLQEEQLSLRTIRGDDYLAPAVSHRWHPAVTSYLTWLRTLYGIRLLYRAAKRRRIPLLQEIIAYGVAPYLITNDKQKMQLHTMLRAVDRAWNS